MAVVFILCQLSFLMPAGLADGLGLGSALSDLEFAPYYWVPRIHYFMDLGLT